MTVVDVVMPYYGDVSLMQAAVRSVLDQDDKRWRLTVVDDGTAEGVPEWFAGLGDDRVRYQRNERNLGVTGNFNQCLSLVEHELVVIMGSDDLMLPNYVSTVLAVHEDLPDAGMIQPGVQVIDRDGAPVRTLTDEVKRRLYQPRAGGRLMLREEALAVSLLRGNWTYFPSLCWKASALEGLRFRAELGVIQDLALLLELVRRGESLVVDPTPCFKYRRHNESVSSWTASDGSRFVEAGNFFLDTADRMREHGWPHAARVARRHLSSRLFALTLLPQALRHRAGAAALAKHAFGPSRRVPTASARVASVASPESTQGADYTSWLKRLEQPLWKRMLDVQAPYRWNVRRLFGEREVLDVGCGIGRNLAHLAPRGVGVDHNEHSIEVCRQRELTAYTVSEFLETEYASPGRFGGLLVAHVIEHMTKPEAVKLVGEYVDYLAPGGIAVFICPQEKGHAIESSHVAFSDFDALSDIAAQVGLTVTRRISFPLPRFTGRFFAYNEFVLVARKPD